MGGTLSVKVSYYLYETRYCLGILCEEVFFFSFFPSLYYYLFFNMLIFRPFNLFFKIASNFDSYIYLNFEFLIFEIVRNDEAATAHGKIV